MRSVIRGLAARLTALGAAVAAVVAVAVTSPSPAGGGVSAAIVVCPDGPGGCTSSNHNQVLL